MKKIITTLIAAPILAVAVLMAGAAVVLGLRYQKNQAGAPPYPYVFKEGVYTDLRVEAPVLIVGDRLGERLSSFSKIMAKKISANLSKPIKIESLAAKGDGLHRTLEKIKSLDRLPLVIIYLGATEETAEPRFLTRDIPDIKKNFALREDERLRTLLMIFPALSKLVYSPVSYQELGAKLRPYEEVPGPAETLKRNEIHFKLFEQEAADLFSHAKDHNSYLIAVSAPLNLDAKPRRPCPGSFGKQLAPKLSAVMKRLEAKDFKAAYNASKDLSLMANANARVLYIHGQIAKKLGKINEARRHLELAAAYDCSPWRGSPVYNQILKETARRHDTAFYDFQKMLTDHWTSNTTFQDDIYPQNLYMEKMANALAIKIKKLLKL